MMSIFIFREREKRKRILALLTGKGQFPSMGKKKGEEEPLPYNTGFKEEGKVLATTSSAKRGREKTERMRKR